jgi:hypothetical protein
VCDNSSLNDRNHIARVIRVMSTEASGSGTPVAPVRSGRVSLSKWVNEKLPPWTELLSAHEVARLTRRHRWILSALTLLKGFPKQERFRGRGIGWHRRDVERWLRSEYQISTWAESAPFSILPKRMGTTFRTQERVCSCRSSPTNRARCSRRTRRRRWRRGISASVCTERPLVQTSGPVADAGVTLPPTFEERSAP